MGLLVGRPRAEFCPATCRRGAWAGNPEADSRSDELGALAATISLVWLTQQPVISSILLTEAAWILPYTMAFGQKLILSVIT